MHFNTNLYVTHSSSVISCYQEAPSTGQVTYSMYTLHMFNKLSQAPKLITTLFTLPRVGLLVPLGVCCQDGMGGELIVAVRTGVVLTACVN